MKTYTDKDGQRYPEYGCNCHIRVDRRTNQVVEVFIRGKGWRKVKKSEKFTCEEIPDLAKPFTDDEFRAYAEKYGVECAQEFLLCCDMMKPHQAHEIMHPDPRKPTAEEQKDFQELFGVSVFRFQDALTSMFHMWTFDILRFDQWMHTSTDFDDTVSCRDNVIRRFGPKAAQLLDKLLDRDAATITAALET